MPATAMIPTIIDRHLEKIRPVQEFYDDCRAGTLPSVSFVDPELGIVTDVGSKLAKLPHMQRVGANIEQLGGSEEAPQDVAFGERWAYHVVKAVLRSPAWPRTLLIYTYDEHGGYYDHVPPPAAIPPDAIGPDLQPGDVAGGYDMYGPRVPAIVVSPYARPHAVSDTVYDHTSVLATIEAKWNLPALTYRDANATPIWDLLDFSTKSFSKPPRARGVRASWFVTGRLARSRSDRAGAARHAGRSDQRRGRCGRDCVGGRGMGGSAPCVLRERPGDVPRRRCVWPVPGLGPGRGRRDRV